MPTTALTHTALPESDDLKFISSGKVRDLYAVRSGRLAASVTQPDVGTEKEGGDEYLLFVATDRISAYDVILQNGVPDKGKLLTQLSLFWFSNLEHIVPNHVISGSLFDDEDGSDVPEDVRAAVAPHREILEGRTMLVRKAEVVKLEAIVRGYLTGSAWAEYKKTKTVHGIPMPDHYVESSKFDEPLFTPSTKADQGQHDENISPDQARELIGAELYDAIAKTAIALYTEAHTYALTRGLILADTKFEFGLVPSSSLPSPNAGASPKSSPSPIINGKSLILVDEALTPDSSRYWSVADYAPGRAQASFDKQFLRDWLTKEAGFQKGLESGHEGHEGEGWKMSEEVMKGTSERYAQAVMMLLGNAC